MGTGVRARIPGIPVWGWTMLFARMILITAVLALAAACGSPSSTTAAPSTSVPGASSVTPTTLTCDQFPVRAANLVSYVHYASLNVGTTNDSAPYFAEMQQAMADLKANAPACAAAGASSLDALQGTVDALQSGYVASDAADAVAANKALFETLVAQGVVTWKALGLDEQAWDVTLRFSA